MAAPGAGKTLGAPTVAQGGAGCKERASRFCVALGALGDRRGAAVSRPAGQDHHREALGVQDPEPAANEESLGAEPPTTALWPGKPPDSICEWDEPELGHDSHSGWDLRQK